jgi:hypothetical protein
MNIRNNKAIFEEPMEIKATTQRNQNTLETLDV